MSLPQLHCTFLHFKRPWRNSRWEYTDWSATAVFLFIIFDDCWRDSDVKKLWLWRQPTKSVIISTTRNYAHAKLLGVFASISFSDFKVNEQSCKLKLPHLLHAQLCTPKSKRNRENTTGHTNENWLLPLFDSELQTEMNIWIDRLASCIYMHLVQKCRLKL